MKFWILEFFLISFFGTAISKGSDTEDTQHVFDFKLNLDNQAAFQKHLKQLKRCFVNIDAKKKE